MTVWVTRTQPGADRVAEGLRKAGFDACVEPVLAVERLKTDSVDGAAFDVCVVLSTHAVQAAPPDCGGYLTVGPTTAEALGRALQVMAEYPEEHSSQGLLAWLAVRRPERTLVVCGEGGPRILQDGLRQLGLAFEERLAYRRRMLSPTVKTRQIQVIELASGDGARAAAQVWFAADGDPQVPVVTPSQRVSEAARAEGFQRIAQADGASVEALIKRLGEL